MNRLAKNYYSLPISIVKGLDIHLWDKNGKKYVDLLAGYSAVNQGPKEAKASLRINKFHLFRSLPSIYSTTINKPIATINIIKSCC
jgi:acetylornithine/succinyldiaminopimelate/putrescine aminotransferase